MTGLEAGLIAAVGVLLCCISILWRRAREVAAQRDYWEQRFFQNDHDEFRHTRLD